MTDETKDQTLPVRTRVTPPMSKTPVDEKFYDAHFSKLPQNYAGSKPWAWPQQPDDSLDFRKYSQEEWLLAIQHQRSLPFIRMMIERPWLFVEEHTNLTFSQDRETEHTHPWYPKLLETFKLDSRAKELELEEKLPFILITQEIFPRLESKDLRQFSLCSVRSYVLANDNELWKKKQNLLCIDHKTESSVVDNKSNLHWKYVYLRTRPTINATSVRKYVANDYEITTKMWYCKFYEHCVIINIKGPKNTDFRWFGKGFIKGDNGQVMDIFGIFYLNNSDMAFLVCDDKAAPSEVEKKVTKQHWDQKFPPGTKIEYFIQWTDPTHPYTYGQDSSRRG